MSMGKMVAKAAEGHEFMYSRKSAHSVPTSSAQQICDALNAIKYDLKEGEVWHVFDCGQYERELTGAYCQSFYRRNGKIYERR